MEDFSFHLKRLRESRGYTVNQLAMYSRISSASISRYESGARAPKPENIKKLAEALKMPYEELMRLAGHLDHYKIEDEKDSEKKELSELQGELFKEFASLSDEDKDYVLGLIRRIQNK